MVMLNSVQYLRAMAALLVVGYHINSYQVYLMSGVDIFFVISGFIMWQSTRGGTSPRQFLTNRLIRIVPLYWLVTFL